MDLAKITQSKNFKKVLYGIGALVIIFLIFRAGAFVGSRKAAFSYRWGENYHRYFDGPRGGFLRPSPGGDFLNPHGVFGKILNVSLPLITVEGPDAEKVISVGSTTAIRKFRDAIPPEKLAVDDFVAVIGSPNESGQIEAKLIRVMPAPPSEPEPFDRSFRR